VQAIIATPASAGGEAQRTSLSSTTCGCLSCLWLIISRSTYLVICCVTPEHALSTACHTQALYQISACALVFQHMTLHNKLMLGAERAPSRREGQTATQPHNLLSLWTRNTWLRAT